MDGWITWENGLLATSLFVAISSLIGLMRTSHGRLVNEIKGQIETERRRRRVEELRSKTELARKEATRLREEEFERIRSGRPAA